MSKIEWTGETWNPTLGCSKVSEGCDGCYAISVAHRGMTEAHRGLTIKRPGERLDWTGEVRLMDDRLEVPLRRKKPTTWFVDSMSDLFHPGVDDLFLSEVFAVMGATPRHTFQVLTKRPKSMAGVLTDKEGEFHYKVGLSRRRHAPDAPAPAWPLPNVWLGTSIESDRYAWRADYLRATPAAVRFLSLEPLLGPLPSLDLTGIDWVIVGGESGPGARPMDEDWVREIRDQCSPCAYCAGTDWVEDENWQPDFRGETRRHGSGFLPCPAHEPGDGAGVAFFYKQRALAGRKVSLPELDGRTWQEMPNAAT